MYLDQYMDLHQLTQHVRDGLVESRRHKTLPLQILTFTKKVIFENAWDDITTKCRGLIVGPKGRIVGRPFEKFFNLNTSYRPETHAENLPQTQPYVLEKLDGSLGIIYQIDGEVGVATTGSFHSDQAEWATAWYKKRCPNPQWPLGFTPVVEIIAESVQHHVVHYNGVEELVLLALIDNVTGEEADYNTLYHWGVVNGLQVAPIYNKTLEDVLAEDRTNREGYVLSYPRPGKVPLKIKVKHESFLALQKIVHAATPKAILEALASGNVDVLDTWIGQSNEPLGTWVQGWVATFNGLYGDIMVKSHGAFTRAKFVATTRKEFADWVKVAAPDYAAVCFAMLDCKDHKSVIWKIVAETFKDRLCQPFTINTELEIAA